MEAEETKTEAKMKLCFLTEATIPNPNAAKDRIAPDLLATSQKLGSRYGLKLTSTNCCPSELRLCVGHERGCLGTTLERANGWGSI